MSNKEKNSWLSSWFLYHHNLLIQNFDVIKSWRTYSFFKILVTVDGIIGRDWTRIIVHMYDCFWSLRKIAIYKFWNCSITLSFSVFSFPFTDDKIKNCVTFQFFDISLKSVKFFISLVWSPSSAPIQRHKTCNALQTQNLAFGSTWTRPHNSWFRVNQIQASSASDQPLDLTKFTKSHPNTKN